MGLQVVNGRLVETDAPDDALVTKARALVDLIDDSFVSVREVAEQLLSGATPRQVLDSHRTSTCDVQRISIEEADARVARGEYVDLLDVCGVSLDELTDAELYGGRLL